MLVLLATRARNASPLYKTWVNPIDGSTLIFVPGGPFTMGTDNGEPDERPAHMVDVPGFWIGRTLVTNAQFATFLNQCGNRREHGVPWLMMGNGLPLGITLEGNRFVVTPGFEEHAAGGVTWFGARAYCEWAGLRLPTEAEWEKAARGTDARVYPWGDDWDAERANGGQVGLLDTYRCARLGTTSVEAHTAGASPYGCLDMAGNVWEWCSSLYAVYPYKADDGRENETSDGERVIRGGSWYLSARHLRTTNRYRQFPTYHEIAWMIAAVGFRVARSESDSAPSSDEGTSGRLRRLSHPIQVPLQVTAPPRISASDDARYRLQPDHLYPSGQILGFPITPEREIRYAVPEERLEETLWRGRTELLRPRQLLSLLGLKKGESVGEIGAGAGFFTWRISDAVGPRGNVWATDISVTSLRFIQRRLQRDPKPNIHLVLHDVGDCLLAKNSLDAAVVLMTQYFYYPRAKPGTTPPLSQVVGFYHSIWRALKPHGRLVIMDKDERHFTQFPGRGPITKKEITRQMGLAGFTLMKQTEFRRKSNVGDDSFAVLVFGKGESNK